MDGASGSHSFWGNALRDLLAGLARFRSPEFEALLSGFIAIATRLRKEFERILDEARRSRFFQDLERMRSGPPVPGYEAFWIGEGYEPSAARLMGHAVNNLGKRLAREREAERTLAGVLRAVIKGEENGPLVAARRAKALRLELDSPDSRLALEKSCRKAGRPELAYELEQMIANESLIGNPPPDTLSSIRPRRCCPACRTRVRSHLCQFAVERGRSSSMKVRLLGVRSAI